MSQNSKELLAAAMLVTVFARDLFLMARKDYGSPIITLEQAQKQLVQGWEAEEGKDQLSLFQLRATKERLDPTESTSASDGRP